MVSIFETPVEKVERFASVTATDLIAVEEPLEIQIEYGPVADRKIHRHHNAHSRSRRGASRGISGHRRHCPQSSRRGAVRIGSE